VLREQVCFWRCLYDADVLLLMAAALDLELDFERKVSLKIPSWSSRARETLTAGQAVRV